MGRPALPLAIDPAWATFVGIKLTGDNAFAVLTDLAGTVLETTQAPLPGICPDEVAEHYC